MFCVVFFPMHVLHIRLVMVPDMCHRLPNDAKLAMQESGMWIFVLLLIPIYNLFWGPWNSCRWAQEAAWAFKELGAFEFSVARWVFEYEFLRFPKSDYMLKSRDRLDALVMLSNEFVCAKLFFINS